MKPLLLVTGDIVLDCHLYGGVKTAATSFSEPGTIYEQHLGGAVLTHRLLEASQTPQAETGSESGTNGQKLTRGERRIRSRFTHGRTTCRRIVRRLPSTTSLRYR